MKGPRATKLNIDLGASSVISKIPAAAIFKFRLRLDPFASAAGLPSFFDQQVAVGV